MLFLKDLRVNSGLTQTQVAEKLQRTKTCICDWERGRCEPPIEDLIKLANIFGCSIDYLVGREDDFGIITSSSTVPELRPEEKQLLLDFNKLSDTNKYKVIGYCHALINY